MLPSLGENAVVLSTIGELFPGVRATRWEPGQVAVLKGRLSMAKVIANAVLDRQRVPKTTIELPFSGGTLRLDAQLLGRAQQRAWQSRRPHNPARAVFLKSVFDQLTRQVARRQRRGEAGHPLRGPVWGRLPGPAPCRVFADPFTVEVHDDVCHAVAVSERGVVSGEPARFRLGEGQGSGWQPVAAWAGPWPVDESWWSEGGGRASRFQLVGVDGRAWLLSCGSDGWRVEAAYD